ncbi:MAG: methyltransferase [Candidatus Magasanikbacteria bacterium]|nr:methyltransferase [Candidatus Magasanikbacteria bacterium]
MKKINLGKKWRTAMASTKNAELFNIYHKKLPLFTNLFDAECKKLKVATLEVADFGGANGEVLGYIKQHTKTTKFLKTTCFDITPNLLKNNIWANQKFLIDLREIKIKNKFDIAIMRYVLDFNILNDQQKIIKNLYRSLKKGGISTNWWCGVENYEHQLKFNEVFNTDKISKKLIRNETFWPTWRQTSKMFHKSGFKLQKIYKFKYHFHNLYKLRYELTEEENYNLLKYLKKYNYICFCIFTAYK